jgi:hypothetical protein
MLRRRLSWAVTAISGPALALGVGGAARAGAASPGSTTSGVFSERTVVVSCLGQPEQRPGTFTLACADGNDYLTGLSWTSWTARLASGYGTQHENDCIPYCAAGHFHAYPVLVMMWGSDARPSDPGTQHYTRITLVYPSARPPVYNGHGRVLGPATTTASLWG